jgi:hypothetical protein
VGLAVSHVLDVASGERLFEAGTGTQTEGVTLLNNRVTGVVSLATAVAPPAGGDQIEDWKELAEEAG